MLFVKTRLVCGCHEDLGTVQTTMQGLAAKLEFRGGSPGQDMLLSKLGLRCMLQVELETRGTIRCMLLLLLLLLLLHLFHLELLLISFPDFTQRCCLACNAAAATSLATAAAAAACYYFPCSQLQLLTAAVKVVKTPGPLYKLGPV